MTVDQVQTDWPWVIHTTDRSRGPVSTSPASSVGGRVVEVGRGLVEHEHRLVGEQRPGDADPGPLAAGDAGVAVAEPGVEARRAARPARRRGARRRRAAPTSSSVASGRASRTFSTSVVAKTCGSSSTSPVEPSHLVEADVAQVGTPPGSPRPSAGSRKRISSAARVLLPDPDGPTTRDPVARREAQGEASGSAGASAAQPRPSRARPGPSVPAGAALATVSRTAGARVEPGRAAARPRRPRADRAGRRRPRAGSATSARASGSSTRSADHRRGRGRRPRRQSRRRPRRAPSRVPAAARTSARAVPSQAAARVARRPSERSVGRHGPRHGRAACHITSSSASWTVSTTRPDSSARSSTSARLGRRARAARDQEGPAPATTA